MSQDNLDTDEEEEEDKVFNEELKNRPGLLLLENGDQHSYLHGRDHDEDIVDVEVDSRLGDTSDEDENISDVNVQSVDQIHVDENSESFSAVSRSVSPPDPQVPSSSSMVNWPPSLQSHQISLSYDYSKDSDSHNVLLPVGDQDIQEDIEGDANEMRLASDDEDVERQVQEVTDEMVDRIANECWDHVNGTYQDDQWHEWDETTDQVNAYDGETFLILPYVHTGW